MNEQDFAIYLKNIVVALVDNPDEVGVVPRGGEQTLLLEIRVAKADLGKVIGKQGSMASALRSIVKSVSTKNGMRAVMEIMED